MAFDKLVNDLIREYPTFIHHAIYIAIIIAGFVAICGCIRFGIAIYRRTKGIYPPAASQMEDH